MPLTAYDALQLWQQANPPGTPVPRHLAAALQADHPGVRLPGVVGAVGGVAGHAGGTREWAAKGAEVADRERGRDGLQEQVDDLARDLLERREILTHFRLPDRAGGYPVDPGWLDDCWGVRDGLVLATELKARGGIVAPEQGLWLRCWGDRGRLCWSYGEVVEFLRGWGVRV